MLQLENKTPFEVAAHLFPDPQAVDTLYVAVKATFTLSPRLEVAPRQVPIWEADEYVAEPGQSSIRYPSEAHPAKPATDVIFVGSAHAPDGTPVEQLTASLQVRELARQLCVSGDRVWTGSWVGPAFTPPEPFETMPLVWERAFGGVHVVDAAAGKVYAEERNPVGCGFRGKRGRSELKGQPLPNIEDPQQLVSSAGDKSEPMGLGCIAPAWLPRRSYAGTYDEAWQKTRAPYLPLDFDPRFFNCAPPALVCRGHLTGGEPVELRNLSPRGLLQFVIPTCVFKLCIDVAGRRESPELRMETLLLEPDDDRFAITWRAALPCDKQVLKVERIEIELDRLSVPQASAR